MKKPADTTYVVYVFVEGRWQGILTTKDRDHAEFMATDVIEGGGKARVEELGLYFSAPKRAPTDFYSRFSAIPLYFSDGSD